MEVNHSRRVGAPTTQVQLHLANVGDAQIQNPKQYSKAQDSQEPQKAPQATNLLRGSDPWRMEGMLRLAEVTRSHVCKVLTLNYECTQVGYYYPDRTLLSSRLGNTRCALPLTGGVIVKDPPLHL